MWKRIGYQVLSISVLLAGVGFASAQTIQIAANNPPQAVPDAYTTNENETLIVSAPGILSNDSDADGDIMSVQMVQTTTAGTLTMQANGAFTYVPNAEYFGTDSFQYKVTDGVNQSGTVTVYITVNRYNNKPTTGNDLYSTPVNQTINIAAPGVLSNDFELDGQALTAKLEIAPKYGSISMQPNGSFTYVPEYQFNGIVVFWYRANDGIDDSPSTAVSIQIGQSNQAPNAVNDTITVQKNTAADVFILSNDSDPEGNLRLLSAPGRSAQSGYVDMGLSSIRYTPRTGFVGTDTFTYTVTDGSYRETATVTVMVIDTTPVEVTPTPNPTPSVPTSPQTPVTNPSTPTATPTSPTPVSQLAVNTLIKGPIQSAVYWIGPDLKRYVFPNEATYKTWFADWKNIEILAENTLSTIPLGKNIPYRPGIRLLKIPSAPTVYAVEKGGLLRPVLSEDVAFRIYGSGWAKFIDDIPESLFVNYMIGEPIVSANQFNPDQVAGTARTLLENYE